MAVDIGPKIGIDGEKEFRKNLNNINQQLKTLGSEMKAVTSAFTDGDNAEEKLAEQTRILNRQIEAQEQKIAELNKGLEKATDKYTKADSRTMRWEQAVHDATAELNRMKSALRKAEGGVDDFSDASDESTGIIGKFTDALGSKGLNGVLAKGLAVGAVVAGVKELSESIVNFVQDTQEYRTIMASLENSSERAGYTAEQTSETYNRFLSVLGDTQTAATATANLQALGLGQENLKLLTDAAIGAWATYGDSIPIDGLAEAINETIRVGQVTGTFADVLNWAGISEDEFNGKLQECASFGDRVNTVLSTLANEGLAEAGQAWIDQNQDIVDMNRSTGDMEQAMGQLGETLAPLAAGMQSFGADVITGVVVPALDTAIEKTRDFIQGLRDMQEEARNAGTSLTGQGWNFDFNDPVANAQLAAPVNQRNMEMFTNAMNAVGSAATSSAQVSYPSEVVVPVTLEIDGAVLARKQAHLNSRQRTLSGTSMID